MQKVLRLAELQKRVPRSRSRIYEDMARGEFPRPVKLGPRSVGWLEHEIEAWLAARVAEREAA
jgi:prophage regulatory protein